jgi:hypothetical protein
MDKLPFALVALLLALVTRGAIRAILRRSGQKVRPVPERHIEKNRSSHGRRYRVAGLAILLFSSGIIVSLVYWAFQLTQPAPIPAMAGAANLLVPGNPFSPSDRFQLGLVSDDPTSRYVEYHIVAGCNSQAKTAILLLSGNARISHVNVMEFSHVTMGTTYVGQPFFSSRQAVQIFRIQVHPLTCPAKVSPSQDGSVTVFGGYVQAPIEDSAGASYALQLPFLGSEEVIDSYIPSLGGYWSPPVNLSVSVNAGGLPLYDRIDVTRPALTGSGGLSWSGQSFIWPSATWTDLSSASRGQFLILVIGALIGIFGAAPVEIVIEWIRGSE